MQTVIDTMAESSSSTTKTVSGTMVWINLNSLRSENWRQHVEAYPRAGNPFQTYLVHTQKRYKGIEPERWWSYQSNVHGVVIASNVLSQESIREYPKISGPIVEHFIPELAVKQTDFLEAKYTDLLTYSGDKKKIFFSALHNGLRCLREVFHGVEGKQEARHIGCSSGIIGVAIDLCEKEADDTVKQEAELRVSGTLRHPQAINTIHRLPEDVREKHDPTKHWESTAEWVVNNNRSIMVKESDVSVLGDNPPTCMILEVLEEELKVALTQAIASSPIRGGIMCVCLPAKEGRATKRAKTEKTQSTLVLNLDYGNYTGIFRREGIVNSVVWLIKYDTLNELLENGGSDIARHGDHRVVTSQTNDKRRLDVKPPLEAAADTSAPTTYFCILLADIHQYVYLYENFKATAKRVQEASSSISVTKDTAEADKKAEHIKMHPDNVYM